MFGLFKKKKEVVAEEATTSKLPVGPEVLGLGLGKGFELDKLNLKLIEPHIIMEGAASTQFIQAVGKVILDPTTTILRFYTDDDGFLQVVLEGGMSDEHVTDVKLFYFYDTKGVTTQSAWDNLLENEVSKTLYKLEGHEYRRVWEDISGKMPPVAMTETTYSEDGKETTDQFAMLYERPVEDTEEYVFISAEEQIVNNKHVRSVVQSTGINLSPSDITVIGE